MEELKRLWNEVECDMFLFHLGSDYGNYTGLEFDSGGETEYDQGYSRTTCLPIIELVWRKCWYCCVGFDGIGQY